MGVGARRSWRRESARQAAARGALCGFAAAFLNRVVSNRQSAISFEVWRGRWMKRTAIVVAALLAVIACCFAQDATAPKPGSSATAPLEAGASKLPFTFIAYGDIRFTEPNNPRKQAASD